MSTFSRCLGIGVLMSGAVMAQESPGLGEAVDADTIADIDYTIMPDGEGLPPGAGNAADGRTVFNQHCIACHGQDGQGTLNDRLAGGHGTIGTDSPVKTVGSYWPYATIVFDYVRRAMPFQSPGVLTNDELYAVTAYVLFLNDIVSEDEILDASSLPDVEMPNRDGFVWGYSP